MTLQAELALLSAFDMADIPVVSSMVATGLGPRVEKQTEGCCHYLELYGLTLSSQGMKDFEDLPFLQPPSEFTAK